MSRKNKGFTLIEILISLGILVVGVVGILTLFPAGLNSTKLAIEDTYAAMVAESAHSAVRAAASQMAPGDELTFFHDGISINGTDSKFTLPTKTNSVGIPGPDSVVSTNYLTDLNADVNANFCRLGQTQESAAADPNFPFNISMSDADNPGQLTQYSFNVEISYPAKNTLGAGNEHLFPQGLFDVIIRVRRGDRLVKKYYSRVFIPTNNDNT